MAAAFVILSSSIDGAAGGGVEVDVEESEEVGGGGGGSDVVDSLVSGDFNIVSPDDVLLPPPDIGGSGGGAESHLVRKIGSNSDDNTMIDGDFMREFVGLYERRTNINFRVAVVSTYTINNALIIKSTSLQQHEIATKACPWSGNICHLY